MIDLVAIDRFFQVFLAGTALVLLAYAAKTFWEAYSIKGK